MTRIPLVSALRELAQRIPKLSDQELMDSLIETLSSYGFSGSTGKPTPSGDISAARPSSIQIGGNHYKHFAIQPSEFCQKNKLDHCESAAIKYLCRHKLPGGKGLQDLQKARHFIDLIIEWEYENGERGQVPNTG